MQTATVDATSLDRLHDIVSPAPLSLWWPPAKGWWFLLGVLMVAAIWFALKLRKSIRANAYRRVALKELRDLQDIRFLPEILKRTALEAFPRSMVAPLTGETWLEFLNSSTASPCFEGTVGETIKTFHYTPGDLPDAVKKDLLDAAERWIKDHTNQGADLSENT